MSIREAVLKRLQVFYPTRNLAGLDDDDNMIDDLACTSMEGVEFANELCDELGVELPHKFNPFVHDSQKRGRTLREMVSAVSALVEKEPADATN